MIAQLVGLVLSFVVIFAPVLLVVLHRRRRNDDHAKHLAAHRAVFAAMPKTPRKPPKAAPKRAKRRSKARGAPQIYPKRLRDLVFDLFAADPTASFTSTDIARRIRCPLGSAQFVIWELRRDGFITKAEGKGYRYAGKAGE